MLDDRTRRLIVLGMMLALARFDEFQMQCEADSTRVSLDELKEVLLLSAIYAGVPVATAAFTRRRKFSPNDKGPRRRIDSSLPADECKAVEGSELSFVRELGHLEAHVEPDLFQETRRRTRYAYSRDSPPVGSPWYSMGSNRTGSPFWRLKSSRVLLSK